jgi:iron complex outermembrane recepter protein
MKFSKRALMSAAATVALSAMVPTVAKAQQQQAQAQTGLEEIVVTAQRREENVQTVPIAITAFSPAELERRNIETTQDLIRFIPNLHGHFNTGPATSNTYFMRGLGNSDTLATIDLPVATYIDEVVISRQNANQLSFFDLEGIEVLRGPQGTLFGRNVTGGAISVKLRKPAEEFGGSAQIGYGRFNYFEARATVDAPVSDKVLTQIGAFYNDDKGYVRNYATGDRLNDATNYGARGAIRGLFSDTLTWDGSLAYMKAEGTNLLNDTCDTLNPGVPANCEGRWVFTGLRKKVPFTNLVIGLPTGLTASTLTGDKMSFDPQTTNANTWIATSNFALEADAANINFITGYVRTEQNLAFDFQSGRNGRSPANPGPAVPFTLGPAGSTTGHPLGSGFTLSQGAVTKQFTQEVKATGSLMDDALEYVAGVYYFDESSNTDIGDIFPLAGTNQGLVGRDQQVRNTTEAWAGYAQVDAHVSEQLTATVGIRYTDESKTFATQDSRNPALVSTVTLGGVARNNRLDTANLAAFGIPTELSAKLWTPRFAVNYQATDDVLLYASATRGFRSGGWNARGAGANSLLSFLPEKVWSYEAGAKTQAFEDRLRFNANFFWMDTKQFQAPVSFVPVGATGPTFLTQNDSDLRNKGIELEAQALPMEGLTLSASLGYQDPKYRNLGTSTAAQLAACKAAIAANAAVGVRFGGVGIAVPGQGGCGQGIIDPFGNVAIPARSPKWTGSIGGNYEIPVDAWNVKVVPAASAQYSGEMQSAAANVSFFRAANGTNSLVRADGPFVSGALTEKVWTINASIGVETMDENTRLTLDCSNCFGEVYNVAGISGYSYLSPPGTWSVKLKTKF